MIHTNLITAFPFYNKLEKQHRFKQQNKYMQPFGLPCTRNAILPFQIKTAYPDIGFTLTGLYVVDIDTDASVLNLTPQLNLIEAKRTTDNQTLYFTYKGQQLNSQLPLGFYYIKLTANFFPSPNNPVAEVFYSEVIEVKDSLANCIKLQWYNNADIEPLLYQTGFKQIVYLETYTEAIAPSLIQEGEENGEGEFVPSFQRAVYKHKFEAFVPDYLQDALAMLPLHDDVQITEQTETAKLYQVKVTNEYSDNYIGTTKVEFELNNKYIKTSCSKNLDIV